MMLAVAVLHVRDIAFRNDGCAHDAAADNGPERVRESPR